MITISLLQPLALKMHALTLQKTQMPHLYRLLWGILQQLKTKDSTINYFSKVAGLFGLLNFSNRSLLLEQRLPIFPEHKLNSYLCRNFTLKNFSRVCCY